MANDTLITLTGKCTDVKIFNRKDYTVAEFILLTPDEHPQHYKVTALTKQSSSDKFGVMDYEDANVEIKAYLNGRKSVGTKGIYFSNDLSLKAIIHQQVK